MHCGGLREKRLARFAASRMMRSPPTSYCVAMAAQKGAFPQVRASRCRDATFMAVPLPGTFMRQLENSWPNWRGSPVNERRGLRKHSSIPDEARLPLTSRYPTKLLGPGESDTIAFTAPYVPADYDFVCLFPGHAAQGMKSVIDGPDTCFGFSFPKPPKHIGRSYRFLLF